MDIEKENYDKNAQPALVTELPAGHAEAHLITDSWFTRHALVQKLFSNGVEALGVERVREEDREHKKGWLLDNLLFWFSVNMVLTTFPIGVLAQEFFSLTFPHAVAIILCFAALGCASTAFISTLGPKTGLRTMVLSRYSGGFLGGSIFSFLNILTQMGFSCTCVILGGQTLASISTGSHNLPLTAGIVIISVCTLIICFFGYNFLHLWERFAWILMTILFIMLYALGGKVGYDLSAQKPLEETGSGLTGGVLSFGAIIFGSCLGWAPVACDYNMKMPSSTSSWTVFWLTFFGLFFPITFVEILGALAMTIQDPAYTEAFANGSAGGLIGQLFSVWGAGGKFLLILLSLSVISNNVPNTYSASLSIQALWKPLQKIPRAIWTIVVVIIYTVAGVAGREHFSTILSNLLSILSYWVAFFVVIIAEEHFIFRRPNGMLGGYDLEVYDQPKKLPVGLACIASGCLGVAGAVIGMAQVYYVGPVALAISSPYGGDLGFELSAVFSAVSYPILRYAEIKHFGR